MDEDERRRRQAEQEAQALHALEAILNGGDLSAESMRLSNDFTDRQTGGLAAWFRRLGRANPPDPAPDQSEA